MPPTLAQDSRHAPASPAPDSTLYIGLMSGTSLDGIDGALAAFGVDGIEGTPGTMHTLATSFMPFPAELRAGLMALQQAGHDEIHREALAANALAHLYAQCVTLLLDKAGIQAQAVQAIGVHGQTIRHVPDSGYTRQTNNPALLAELTGIDVIAEFRHRDIAAGGQGAPLVPAFHHWLFGECDRSRVVLNLGGIANITVLHQSAGNAAVPALASLTPGFDTGPANVLMDEWITSQLGQPYDADGAWASSGKVDDRLLQLLRAEPYFAQPAPKSTGRDLFNASWLNTRLRDFPDLSAADVQATLADLTATTVADAIHLAAPEAVEVYACGGGAMNTYLMQQLQQALVAAGSSASVKSTAALGVAPNHVEALAFAWLAERFHRRLPANLPRVTGAAGLRLLGALYPA